MELQGPRCAPVVAVAALNLLGELCDVLWVLGHYMVEA